MSSNKEFESNISFDLPKNQSNVIKVIGVGGGGSNAINHMFQQGIKGVDFVICNTDAQALQNSGVPNKIQLGVNLTEGLGAGANPDVGEKSAIESFEDIQRMLDTNTKMVFITAGMGGGTGTGAAPIIAKMAKDLDILTVGIVTMPFQFEGKMRNEQAQIGIENLRSVVDSLVVINNNKLREVYGNLGFKAGFSKADEVLSTAARGIAEVITHHYTQNIDLRDAKTVLSNSGTAIMGSATSSGQNRAHDAISKALDSPLLNDNKITGAKNVLLLIVSGSQEITIDEIGEINDHIQNEAGHGANIIMGVGEDESLEESIAVTIIATGFNIDQQDEISNTEAKKVIHALEEDKPFEQDLTKKEQAPPIITPNIELEEKKEPPVVKHTLDLDELEELDGPNHILSENELVPTTEAIKNMDVVYDEVLVNAEEEDFVITEVQNTVEEPKIEFEEEQQITLTFDMPISNSNIENKDDDFVVHDLDENIKKIPVNDYVEIIPVTETNEHGETRYALDDYVEIESGINKNQKQEKVIEIAEELDKEIVFEKKVVKPQETEETSGEIDPMNTPISELLKERAEERRRKMKDFNYKFNNSKIDDIEKTPAYKRRGIDLDETQHSSETNMSKTSVSIDDNDDIQFRSNNSFLHDNVD
ncbi:MAG: cell division protein FtsZ [Xanthomarina sp.]|uniref:Cell division protein FtsZ n=2 Tax=Xanthomarina gelatinilytica TaxID=1137281 RepID=M7N1H0_9FLAO|nr:MULTISPECIES: cell division protein FtsZ [Xanthomarina]EMQ95594.1 Cell division protein FtsZ [Xanthomarina gelatinilytica]MAL23151.1 cell division protein FtsZ [Xanthomarina sp.]MBF60596.1 cell division protein FtsZ [Xanthomarina sp.]MDX1317045.1 cell division protein FtsZ [Xanthomarina gelatinilytica]HAI19075.1 cell division protein FtsZ [Xanthomarina gelatinilytica]|tara:strand:- start:2304 stop:4244 length:1941 start_codon:yes stop_codon:yes gene_type:complete